MPKASFASKDAYEPKLGFQEGWGEIVEARTQVFQYPANRESGEQTPAFLAAVLLIQKTDDQGNPVEEEAQEKVLRVEKDLHKMRPGQATARDDQDPEDQGDELDTQGNTIYIEDGAKINKNSSWMVFVKSLEDKGFKAEILGEGYIPDLVGLRGHFVTTKGEKRNIGGRDVEPAYFLCDKITRYPYEQKAKATARTVAKPASSGTATNGNAKAAAAAAAANDAEAVARRILVELAPDLAGSSKDIGKVKAMAYGRLMKDKSRDRKQDKDIQTLFADADFLAAVGAELDLWIVEEGSVVFADAVPA